MGKPKWSEYVGWKDKCLKCGWPTDGTTQCEYCYQEEQRKKADNEVP